MTDIFGEFVLYLRDRLKEESRTFSKETDGCEEEMTAISLETIDNILAEFEHPEKTRKISNENLILGLFAYRMNHFYDMESYDAYKNEEKDRPENSVNPKEFEYLNAFYNLDEAGKLFLDIEAKKIKKNKAVKKKPDNAEQYYTSPLSEGGVNRRNIMPNPVAPFPTTRRERRSSTIINRSSNPRWIGLGDNNPAAEVLRNPDPDGSMNTAREEFGRAMVDMGDFISPPQVDID